jgi:hypothetical protein
MTDPLAPLLDLADVPEAMAAARDSVDGALRHPALRRSGGPIAAELGLRSAVASAALDGHAFPLDDVRAGTVTDPVVQGALRVSQELDGMAALWPKVPRQVLARMHLLAARDSVPAGELGRPSLPDDRGARMSALVDLVTGGSTVPTVLLAAVVHAELATMVAFPGPNGVVARAAGRLTLLAGGLDPRGLIAPELGHLARQPEYVGALNAYATGTPDGLRSWLRHYATAVTVAAEEAVTVGDEVLA